MANIADAADDVAEEGKGASKRRFSKKTLMIAGGAAAALLVAGGGAYVMMGSHGSEQTPAEHAQTKPPSFIELPEMLVNLSVSTDRPRYLKAQIALEVADEPLIKQIEPMMPRIIDSFQVHLREMRPDDLQGSAATYRLKEELLRRINQAVYPAKVDAILFKELLLQ